MNQSKQDQPREKKERSALASKPLYYILSIVVLAVIAVAMIGGPAIGGATRRGTVSFGEYAGEPITVSPGNYFQRSYQNYANYVQSTGQEITEQIYYYVWRSAFDATVTHMALLHAAESAGAGVSTEYVDEQLVQWGAFQVDGEFSLEEYESMSAPDMMVLRDYLDDVHTANIVAADIGASATFSESEIDFILSMAGPERRFRFVSFASDTYPDSEVLAYAQENQEQFRKIGLSQITIDSSESDAQSIREQAVNRTSSFEDLARNQSSDLYAQDGGARDWVYAWDLEFDFEDPGIVDDIFSLRVGDISQVYTVGTQWRIYTVTEAPVDADFTDEETLAAARSYVTSYQPGLVQDYMTANAESFVTQARAEGFDVASLAIDQEEQLTDYFPVNYGSTPYFAAMSAGTNSTLANSGAYREELFQELFALEPGEITEPVTVFNYVFVFQLDDERELTDERVTELRDRLPGLMGQQVLTEAEDRIVNDELFTDTFLETYSTAVLGQ